MHCIWKNLKKLVRKNKFKTSEETWDQDFELSDETYSISNIQDYFEYIIKKHETLADKPLIQIYIDKIQNRVKFQIISGYYLQLLTPETMKILGNTEEKISKDKNSENVPRLKIIRVVLNHCNITNNQYYHGSKGLPIFVPKNTFDQPLNIFSRNHI